MDEKNNQSKPTLDELLDAITEDNKHDETNTDIQGRELL